MFDSPNVIYIKSIMYRGVFLLWCGILWWLYVMILLIRYLRGGGAWWWSASPQFICQPKFLKQGNVIMRQKYPIIYSTLRTGNRGKQFDRNKFVRNLSEKIFYSIVFYLGAKKE